MAYTAINPEIQNAGISNVIPSYASLSEAVLYIMEANDRDIYNIKRDIGLKELGVLESTGSQMVYEEANIKSIKDKIVAFAQKAWERIREIANNVLLKLNKLVTSVVAKIGKSRLNSKNIDEGLDKIDKIGVKSYPYDNLYKFIKEGSLKLPDNSIKEGTALQECVRDYLRGANEPKELSKADVKAHFEEIKESITNFKSVNDNVKRIYTSAKKKFDEEVSEIKNNKLTDADKELIEKKQSNIKYEATVYSTALAEYYACVRTNVSIVAKIASKGNAVAKADAKSQKAAQKAYGKKTPTGAAVATVDNSVNGTTESTSYANEVASLFDWDF